jgi:hypothetical protein
VWTTPRPTLVRPETLVVVDAIEEDVVRSFAIPVREDLAAGTHRAAYRS